MVYTDRSIYRPGQKILWKVVAYHGRARDRPPRDVRAGGRDAAPARREQRGRADGDGHDERLRIRGGRVRDPARPRARRVAHRELAARRGERARRGVQASDLRGEVGRAEVGGAAEPGGVADRIREVLLRAAGHVGLRALDGDASAAVPVVVVLDAPAAEAGRRRSSRRAAPRSRTTARSRRSSCRRRTSASRTPVRSPTGTRRTRTSPTRAARRAPTIGPSRLGLVSVRADVDLAAGFLREQRASDVTLRRTDLDGTPRAGTGRWRLLAIVQPDKHAAPRGPAAAASPPDRFATPGDRLRPRWDTGFSVEQVLHGWKDGAEKAHGDASHDAKGEARVSLPALTRGRLAPALRDARRVRRRLRDLEGLPRRGAADAGARCPACSSPSRPPCRPAETARLLAFTGLPGQTYFLEILRDARVVSTRTLDASSPALIELPVSETDRGGFSARFSLVSDHQLVQETQARLRAVDGQAARALLRDVPGHAPAGLEGDVARDGSGAGGKRKRNVRPRPEPPSSSPTCTTAASTPSCRTRRPTCCPRTRTARRRDFSARVSARRRPSGSSVPGSVRVPRRRRFAATGSSSTRATASAARECAGG